MKFWDGTEMVEIADPPRRERPVPLTTVQLSDEERAALVPDPFEAVRHAPRQLALFHRRAV